MAMVRTIQHPGVEIHETEVGSYSSTIVMNNAYIMGYTDRGPIYDYSWIMNTRDFTKIYGEPQTEAEKYLFTAVQSVLANGGTPIVARMPYDNKQCKAYKALKMKWSDVTDKVPPFNDTDLATPVIPLSAVAGEINMNRDFKDIFTSGSVTIDDQPVSQEYINNLSLSQIVKQLCPFKSGTVKSGGTLYDNVDLGFKLNGVYPSALSVSQEAVSSMIESLDRDRVELVKKVYVYDEGYNVVKNQEDNLSSKFVQKDDTFYPIYDLYYKLESEQNGISAFINLFGQSTETFVEGYPVYLASEIPEDVWRKIDISLSGDLNRDNVDQDFIGKYSKFFTIKKKPIGNSVIYTGSKFNVDALLGSYTNNYQETISGTIKDVGSINFDTLNRSVEFISGEIIAYMNFKDNVSTGFIVPTKFNKKFVYTKANYENISSYVEYFKESDDFPVIDKDKLISVFSYTGETDKVLVGDLIGSIPISSTINLDSLLPIYANTYNGYSCDSNGIPTGSAFYIPRSVDGSFELSGTTCHTLVGFYNADVESPAISGEIKIKFNQNEKDPTTYTVWSEPCLSGEPKQVSNKYGDTAWIDFTAVNGRNYKFKPLNYQSIKIDGTVTFVDHFNMTYTGYLDDIPVVSIDDDSIISSDLDDFCVWIKTIYNSTKLLPHSENEIVKFDASLMLTPEMGFKYGLFLDSEDCEISNDQYDDLVTVNQFKSVDRTVDRYGHDIDDANFIIVDKQKTVVQGTGGNIGFFTAIVDPFDALKVQRILVNPEASKSSFRKVKDDYGNEKTFTFDHSESNMGRLDYWAYEAAESWNQIYDELLDSMDCLQRVRNADGIYVGEPNPIDGKLNILDSWALPLTGSYYDDSISKTLMRKFPGISMADIDANSFEDETAIPSIIDHQFSTHIMVAVCKTTIDQATGKIIVSLVETFFGSLFNEVNTQNGRSLFIGDIINGNSDYIEFYRNNYVSAGDAGAYDPPEYRRTDVNQIFIKDSVDLKNAAQLRGIDGDDYGLDSINPIVRAEGEAKYYKDLAKKHIYVIDKKEVCVYNLHWEANFTSFSRKESQKIIANTSGLYSVNDGTTINVAKNFLIDMDRCINFIKNRDDLPLHFVCDAGLSTIAQFCDNVIWNPNKLSVVGEKINAATKKKTGEKIYETTGGWITQPFSPDDDPDSDDRIISDYSDIATWRRVVEKIDSICSDIRKDCFAIVDAPRQLTLDGAAPKLRRTKFNNNFDKTIGRCLRFITGFNTSYSAGYYNWLRTIDQYTGRAYWIPPTSKIIGNYCYLNINNLPWLAPAGLTYGLISGCHAISHNPDYQEEDQIYLKSWNYIKQYPAEGFVIEGQKTLLGKESVFERLNVRLLFLDLERFAYNVSRSFKYTVNNTYTREQFVATLKPKFEDYAIRGGIYEYLIKVDSENNTPETIDANELRGDIFIKPARLIEYILLNFVGTTTGTDFNELPMG